MRFNFIISDKMLYLILIKTNKNAKTNALMKKKKKKKKKKEDENIIYNYEK